MNQNISDHKKDTWHLLSHRNNREEEARQEAVPPREDGTSQPRDVCAVQRTRDWPVALGAASEKDLLVAWRSRPPEQRRARKEAGSWWGQDPRPAVTAPCTSCPATRQPCL